ncbi:MAG: HNH endonuclease [Actinobacteria bacterium]|nr:HNH endonuclease [Actinomycetota bacterium]
MRSSAVAGLGRTYVVPAGWAAAQAAAPFADIVAADLDGYAPKARQACASAAWTGPQTRSRIETVLCDARISRVLTDGLGQVIGLEALHDEVTTAQRRTLAYRDLGCIARGCTRPPAFCDAHHLRARKDGGSTDLGNLVLLCKRHHVMWHQGRLQLRNLHVPWLTNRADRPPQLVLLE